MFVPWTVPISAQAWWPQAHCICCLWLMCSWDKSCLGVQQQKWMGVRTENLRDLRGREGVDRAKIVSLNAGLITGNRWEQGSYGLGTGRASGIWGNNESLGTGLVSGTGTSIEGRTRIQAWWGHNEMPGKRSGKYMNKGLWRERERCDEMVGEMRTWNMPNSSDAARPGFVNLFLRKPDIYNCVVCVCVCPSLIASKIVGQF